MCGINNRIIGQGRIGHDKVLLSRLKSLDKAKIGIIEYPIGISTVGCNERVCVGCSAGEVFFFEEFVGLFVAEVCADGGAEFVVFFLEEGDGLLEGF